MGLVYIEFIRRLPGVDLNAFRTVLKHVQSTWSKEHSDDRLVLAVGRTWRIGPEPEYVFAWYTPGSGLERIDGWERTFVAGDAAAIHEPFKLAARIERAGCYEPLTDPSEGSRGRYLAHWFAPRPGATRADLREYFETIAAGADADLNLAVLRIGALAPDPPGLAVWGVGSWAHVAALSDPGSDSPIDVVTSSLLADIGHEQH
jgi:hypothetical protein